MNKTNYKSIKNKLIWGFAIIICFSFLMGGSSIINIQKTSNQTESMYNSPYEGVKSILTIKSDIIKIHSLMQNISMSGNEQDIIDLSKQIKETENKVFEQFKVFERSEIADPKDLMALKTQFIDWNPIREEVTNLCLAGMNEIAGNITNEIGSKHVENLNLSIEKLTVNAQEKAESFRVSSSSSSQHSLIINGILMFVMTIFSILAATITTKTIVPPIKRIQQATQKLSQGDLEIVLDNFGNNEIGALADSLAETIETLSHYISEISHILSLLAQGDMMVSVNRYYKGSFLPIKLSLNEIASSLNQMLHRIKNTAEIVASSSQNVRNGAKNLSEAVYKQGESIELLSNHINLISEQSIENSVNANEINILFEAAMTKADSGKEHMNNMLISMEHITQSSRSIENIIKSIEEIAFQTSILSLNASIEAANAGEHGSGFAVVASEVRELASKSTQAAKETRGLVLASLEKVAHGEIAADEAAASLKDIISGIQEAVTLINKIQDASKRQSKEINETVKIVEEIVIVVDQTSHIAAQSVEESTNMFEQAEILREMTESFKLRKEIPEDIVPAAQT